MATTQDYNEHTHFNEGNITSYLAELEEYIAQLITYTAHKKGDPNASISAIPFTKLTQKDWLARDMAIEPAYEITVDTTADQEEEEGSVDVNTLYDRFQDKIAKDMIRGNRKNDARTNQLGRTDD